MSPKYNKKECWPHRADPYWDDCQYPDWIPKAKCKHRYMYGKLDDYWWEAERTFHRSIAHPRSWKDQTCDRHQYLHKLK